MADLPGGSSGEPASKKPRASDIFETFKEKRYESTKKILEASFSDICHNRQYSIVPMKIRNCNASYLNKGFSFSKANCDTVMYEQLYHFTKIFERGEKLLQSYLESELVPTDENMKQVLSKLLTYAVNEECHVALEKVRKDKMSETKLAMRLGHHLFSKLSSSSSYRLDQLCHGKGNIEFCDCGCKEKFKGRFEDTSIGHPDCWHGHIDILVEGSVPVEVQEESSEGSPGGKSPVEVKLNKRDIEETDVISQVVAQTIVFSFLQKQRHPKHDHFLTPGICVSSKFIAFHFYDCEHDILLRSPAITLFTVQRRINMRAVLAIWLVVNYKYLCSGLSQALIDKGHNAHFFQHAEDKLSLYKNHLTMKGVSGVDEWEPFFPEHLDWNLE